MHPVALGDECGEVEMFENDYSPSSSLLPMRDRHRELWPWTAHDTKIEVSMRTLDSLAAEVAWSAPLIMKLDVQGFELNVLRGAVETLGNCAGVFLEVLFEPLYEGQTDFRALMDFLADHGFRFSEFLNERRVPPEQKLVYADAAFLNTRLVP